jgi:hypothetical protein
MDLQLMNAGAENSQKMGGVIKIAGPNGAASGTGDLGTFVGSQGSAVDTPVYGTSAVTTTSNAILAISVTHGGVSSSETFNKEMVVTELLQ